MTSAAALEWRERVRLHQETLRKARYDAGLCGRCGGRAPDNGFKTCTPCLERARTDRKALRASQRRGGAT